MKHFALVVLASVLALAGCESLTGKPGAGPVPSPIVAQLAVQYAAGKFVEAGGSTPAARAARAKQVKGVVLAVQSVAAGSTPVTVDALESLAQQKIQGAPLEPSDRLLATALVSAVAAELKNRVSVGVIPPEKLVALQEVLGWVLTTCGAYGA